MIQNFHDKTTEDIHHGTNSRQARRVPMELHGKCRRLMDQIDSAPRLQDLAVPPGNNLHELQDDLRGFHSINVNKQWRIIFRWVNNDAHDLRIVDYH